MKVVILAGGLGTRLSEETVLKPKPMVEIGGMPILWHIMKIYSSYGYNDFIICLGYKGYVIKEYFMNYYLHNSDVTIDLGNNSLKIHDTHSEPWQITLVDTGLNTMTGGRIKRIEKYIENSTFLLTYGDGVGDVNIGELVKFHQKQNLLCTVTSVQPTGRFGALTFDETGKATSFTEKPKGDGTWINGGFFVCEPEILNYISDDLTVWEKEPLETIAKKGELAAYRHRGYWTPMDTLRDKLELETEWQSGNPKWKCW